MMAEIKLNKDLQIKYWQRCLRSVLPNAYTASDSSRTSLAFFILSALDLLSAGAETFDYDERNRIRGWLLTCQHPMGGFCGSPNHKYREPFYDLRKWGDSVEEGNLKDPPNLEATFFAVLALSFVGGISGVNRQKVLTWLRTIQREDGSFGEHIGRRRVVEGGRDMRHCLCAAALRKLLRDEENDFRDEIEDIDMDKLVQYIQSGETYDGGLSESSEHEAHAGYTYCAIAALSLLDRLPEGSTASNEIDNPSTLLDTSATIRWLVSRQVAYSSTKGNDEEEDDLQSQSEQPANASQNMTDAVGLPELENLSLNEPLIVGFNGRCNKPVDTCYCYWTTGALALLHQSSLIDKDGLRLFLLSQTQHRIGGFGKSPGHPPDMYHSYLALATLAIMGEEGIKPLDSALCISIEAREILEKQISSQLELEKRKYAKKSS